MANFLHGRRSLVELAEALGLNPLKRHITAITIDAKKINTVTVVVVEYAGSRSTRGDLQNIGTLPAPIGRIGHDSPICRANRKHVRMMCKGVALQSRVVTAC